MTGRRTAVVGAGLAGTMLAWRLAMAAPERAGQIHLFTGRCLTDGCPDATEVSGGLVRGFEVDDAARRLACSSLAELTGSATLRRWAGYREVGSVYLCPDGDALGRQVDEVNAALPGSADLVRADRLGGPWARGADHAWAVVERRAGYVRPAAFRQALLAELRRLGVGVIDATVTGLDAGHPAGPRLQWSGDARAYEMVVLATGSRTGKLLTRWGLADLGFEAKHIQYGLYEYEGPSLPSFVDDTTGLYGRPDGEGRVLLGVPSDAWSPDLDRPQPLRELQRQAEHLAALRLPAVRLGRPVRIAAGADCYGEPGHLSLRQVPAATRLYTFTGGSGGSAKLALASSAAAAQQLEGSVPTQGVYA